MPHPELTLEKRIAAELTGLDAKLCVFADDLRGHTVELGADEPFESASTIKIFPINLAIILLFIALCLKNII